MTRAAEPPTPALESGEAERALSARGPIRNGIWDEQARKAVGPGRVSAHRCCCPKKEGLVETCLEQPCHDGGQLAVLLCAPSSLACELDLLPNNSLRQVSDQRVRQHGQILLNSVP